MELAANKHADLKTSADSERSFIEPGNNNCLGVEGCQGGLSPECKRSTSFFEFLNFILRACKQAPNRRSEVYLALRTQKPARRPEKTLPTPSQPRLTPDAAADA